jgi:hypothetical protein
MIAILGVIAGVLIAFAWTYFSAQRQPRAVRFAESVLIGTRTPHFIDAAAQGN